LGGEDAFSINNPLSTTATVFVRKQKVTGSQDGGFVGGLEIQLVGYAENTKRSEKSQALLMTKRRERRFHRERLLDESVA
jgi:hypothetical protein